MGKKDRIPKAFVDAYPASRVEFIDKDDFTDFPGP
jgi:hypothetical protein